MRKKARGRAGLFSSYSCLHAPRHMSAQHLLPVGLWVYSYHCCRQLSGDCHRTENKTSQGNLPWPSWEDREALPTRRWGIEEKRWEHSFSRLLSIARLLRRMRGPSESSFVLAVRKRRTKRSRGNSSLAACCKPRIRPGLSQSALREWLWRTSVRPVWAGTRPAPSPNWTADSRQTASSTNARNAGTTKSEKGRRFLREK